MNKLNSTFKQYVYDSDIVKSNVVNGFKEDYKMKKSYIWAFLVVALVIGVASYFGYKGWNNRALSFVTISINPEVELALNEADKVVEVIPINEDADVLTSNLDLVGLTVDEASNKIVDEAVETGYIDEYEDDNTVVVTTANDDEVVRKTLEDRIMTQLNAHLEAKKVYAVLVAKDLGDDLKEEAVTYGISNGKMLLVEEAMALNPDLNKDDLVKMSVRDIQKTIKDYVKERHAALKQTLSEAKEKWQTEKQELKQTYKAKIDELKASITEEQKEAFKNMTPAEKQEAIKNILNQKKEAIKNSIDQVKEEIKNEIKEDMQNYNYPILKNNAATIKQNIKDRINQRRNSTTNNQ